MLLTLAIIVRNYAEMFQQPIIIHEMDRKASRGSIFPPIAKMIRRQLGGKNAFHYRQSIYRIYVYTVIEVHATGGQEITISGQNYN